MPGEIGMLLCRGAHFGAFSTHGAELEFGDLAERVERRVGQEIGGGLDRKSVV